jgi:hypothetical protein
LALLEPAPEDGAGGGKGNGKAAAASAADDSDGGQAEDEEDEVMATPAAAPARLESPLPPGRSASVGKPVAALRDLVPAEDEDAAEEQGVLSATPCTLCVVD